MMRKERRGFLHWERRCSIRLLSGSASKKTIRATTDGRNQIPFRRAYDTSTVHYRRCSRWTVEAVAGACGLLADLTSRCPALRTSRGLMPPGRMPFFPGCCSAL